jgi:uncharacterized protein YegP (UPF0339 family)
LRQGSPRYDLDLRLGTAQKTCVATNGQVIASSESYASKAGAVNAIESIKRNAPAAEIDDQTNK